MWSRNKANLYIRDALDDFYYDPKALPSPITQRKIYRNKLMLTHLIGFGGGVGAAAAGPDVTSYAFDGASHLQIPDHADWDLTGDFTAEFFVREPTLTGEPYLWVHAADNNNIRRFRIDGVSGALKYQVIDASSTVVSVITNSSVLTANTWHHIMLVRNNDDYYIFVDGTDQVSSGSPDSSSVPALAGDVYIGQRGDGTNYFSGSLDEIRVSDTARYTSGFSVETSQFESDANTLLLIHCGEAIASGTTGSGATFVDSGNTGHTVTENGNAIRDTSSYKF